MKTPTIHVKDRFETNLEFQLFLLTRQSDKLDYNRMELEFAEAVVDKYEDYLLDVLDYYPQLNLICDSPRVACAFAARWETKDVKPQRMKFKADFVLET